MVDLGHVIPLGAGTFHGAELAVYLNIHALWRKVGFYIDRKCFSLVNFFGVYGNDGYIRDARRSLLGEDHSAF